MPLGLSGSGEITGFDPTASGFGKVLQVVRATDSTQRDTTSTTFEDAGLSVTITPTSTSSKIILIHSFSFLLFMASAGEQRGFTQITDSSNNALSGAQDCNFGGTRVQTTGGQVQFWGNPTVIAYSTPATTSAVSYKVRFAVSTSSSGLRLRNNVTTGQMYAIEVAA